MQTALAITAYHKTTFLYQVAKLFAEKYGTQVSHMWFVFPNRRNGLFFQQYLSSFFDKPLFAPGIFTINELFNEFSPLLKADATEMLFKLYKVYIEQTGKEESFDEFWNWGETLLSDFDDIDTYQVNAEQLFTNIVDLKAIDDGFSYLSDEQIAAIKRFWSSFESHQSDSFEAKFLSIWPKLYGIYTTFKAQLIAEEKGYTGMICEDALHKLDNGAIKQIKASKIVFIGLNALNASEKELLNKLKMVDKADFYWDFFSQELKDPTNKAGLFLQRNVKAFPSAHPLNALKTTTPEINIYSVPSHTGLTRQAGWLLKEAIPTAEANSIETAVVLTDEQLLMPMVHQLPDTVNELNITMGYPIINSPVYGFIRNLLDLQNNVSFSNGEARFYHKHVLSLLSHNYIKMALPDMALEYTKTIHQQNMIVVEQPFFEKDPLLNKIFRPVTESGEFIAYMQTLLKEVAKFLEPNNEEEIADNETPVDGTDIEREFIYHVFIALTHFDELVQKQAVAMKRDTMMMLVRKLMETIAIPFSGEPLKGLQILGVLETRTMDFKNLIIMPMNEGTFPQAGAAKTIIPYNLRKGFGLPTIEDQDAIYAYYFYRLLQRAENVHLLYNSKTDGLVGGERSRFIYQMKYLYPFHIKEMVQKLDIKLRAPKEICITKDESVQQQLCAFTTDGNRKLSVSALNDYLDCSLKFYFKHLMKLREEEELTDSVDARTFGTIFHYVMEQLYINMEDKVVDKAWITAVLESKSIIINLIKVAFAKEYFKKNEAFISNHMDTFELKGKYLIIANILETYIVKALELDRDFAPFTYLKGEYLFERYIVVSDTLSVGFKGYIDRLDKHNDQIRIIDYKTGGDKLDFTNLDTLFSHETKRPKAVFQTLAYAMIYKEINNRLPLVPAIYKIQEFFKDFDPYIKFKPKDKALKGTTIDDLMPEYAERFKTLLSELFNPDISFNQTEVTDTCKYCDFKGICRR